MDPVRVAKIRGPRGLKGELICTFFADPSSWLKKTTPLAIGDDEARAVPMKLKSLSGNNQGHVLGFAEVVDRTAAEKLVGQFVFADRALFASKPGEPIFLGEVMGFTVYDGDVVVGPVTEFTSNGPQDILVVRHDGRDVQIPFIEAFLRDIDFKSKSIHMQLPEGLWQEID